MAENNEQVKGPDYLFKKISDKKAFRKRHIRNRRLFYLGVFGVILLLFMGYYYSDFSKVSYVSVTGNHFLTSEEVVQVVDVKEGDFRLSVSTNRIKNKLEDLPIVDSVRAYFMNGILNIEITEKKPVGYWKEKEITVLFSDMTMTQIKNRQYKWLVDIPVFSGFNRTFDKLENLVKNIDKLDVEILQSITKISLYPLRYDDKMLYVNFDDGNHVMVTMNSLAQLNDYYYPIVRKLNNKDLCIYIESSENNPYTSACPWNVVEEAEENTSTEDKSA